MFSNFQINVYFSTICLLFCLFTIQVPEERRDNAAPPDSTNAVGGGGTRAYEHGSGLHDGAWHTIRVTFGEGNGVVQAHLDGEAAGKQLTLDSSVDLLQFVAAASRSAFVRSIPKESILLFIAKNQVYAQYPGQKSQKESIRDC